MTASPTPVVGLFDSGFGGLTVLGPVASRFPFVDYRFVADAGRSPYGDRTYDELLAFGSEIISFLTQQRMTHLIVACNTTCATVLPELQKQIRIPVWGLIASGAKAAVAATHNKRVAVLATTVTAKSKAYTDAITALDPTIQVTEIACPLLVPLIQADQMASPACAQACKAYMDEVDAAGADTVVLGCSHYPYLVPLFQRMSKIPLQWVDPAPALVADVSASFQRFRKGSEIPIPISFFVSGSLDHFNRFIATHHLFSHHPFVIKEYRP